MAHIATCAVVHVIDATTYWIASDVIASISRPLLPLLVSLVTGNALTYTLAAGAITAIDAHDALVARQARETLFSESMRFESRISRAPRSVDALRRRPSRDDLTRSLASASAVCVARGLRRTASRRMPTSRFLKWR